jgi:two-component system, cell cycle sensor histidine kinase and response regulator CckA
MSEEQSGSGKFDRQSAFRSLYQHMLEGVALHELVIDETGRPINYRILDVNPQYRRYVGIEDADAIGKLATEAYGIPEPPYLAEFARAAMTGEAGHFEAYFPPFDRYYDISVAPFGNLQFATIFLDVSERKRHEIALRDSEWFLRRSQHIARIGSFRMVFATGCWTSTEGLDDVFGIGPEHRRDMDGWISLVHPDDREEVHQHLVRDVMRDGKDFDRRYRIVRPCDGGERWVRVMGEVEKSPCGASVGIVGVLQDVTDNTLVEHELRASEERFRRIFDVIPEPLVLSDVDGNVVNCNDAFCAGVGCSRDEVIGKSPQVVAAWLNHELRRKLYAELVDRKAVDGLEFKFRRRDGQIRTMLLAARLFDISGRPVVLTAARDVTDQRNLEQQMLHSQKLESLGVLAGGIAHDFNNLLTGILGNADLAKTEMSPLAPSRASLEGIEVAARRAADLCRQLLAYSGRGRFIIQPISLQELVEEMGHLLSVSISKKVVLKYHFSKGIPAVEADATQLRQVIMNLIVNASEAIGERSGVISITVGLASCDAAYLKGCFGADQMQPGDYVYLEVADTGHGMDKATLDRVFDPFFSTKFTGRGLGLAAVLGIMRGHHGAIRVYSEPGRGTTFKLLLPASESSAARLESRAVVAPPAYHASGKILLADDEETVRNLGRRMLQRAGFDVIVAADGREAIEKFAAQKETIALVILDLTMPHSDGEVCYREMRQLKPGVKVILSSGYNEQDIVNRFAGKGLSGFVQKPYTTEELLSKIREALG